MSERESNQPFTPGRVLEHDEWEGMIADALDGSLPAADLSAFERHTRECAQCARMLEQTREGKGWMEYLAAHPEPPADLLHKILSRTSQSAASDPLAPSPSAAPPAGLGREGAGRRALRLAFPSRRLPGLLPAAAHLGRQLLEPRLMMTVAMAFFSIALTLNLVGVRLTDLHASDFAPWRLRATLARQYYAANEQVAKYYENLRLVYEVEARVRELRRSTEALPVSAPSPASRPTPAPPRGSSQAVPKGQQTPLAPPPARGRRDGVAPTELVRHEMPPSSRILPGPLALPAAFAPQAQPLQPKPEVYRNLSLVKRQAHRSLV